MLTLFPIDYRQIIEANSNSKNLDGALVASIIFCESRYRADARSSKGALGLMQVMPSTAKIFAKDDNCNLFSPLDNIDIGTSYLSYLFLKYEDETLVLACYNAGESVARSWAKNGRLEIEDIAYKETQNYVQKVRRMKKYYRLFFN